MGARNKLAEHRQVRLPTTACSTRRTVHLAQGAMPPTCNEQTKSACCCSVNIWSGAQMRKLRVGMPITPEELEELSDAQLVRLVPKAYREFFPGKDFCADGHFYLHDGTAWCFFKGDLLDD
ncbi:MAG: hypothetical protein JHC40_11580 [Burkholderiales bacterium]|nr:hypothetical protein [Burkholderiales bacterium]